MELLTEKEAAAIAKVHPRTIRRLIERAKLPAVNYGLGRKRIYRIEPAALLNVQPVQPPPPRERHRRRPIVQTARPVMWPPPPEELAKL